MMWGEEDSNQENQQNITIDLVGILEHLTRKRGWRESKPPVVRDFEVDFYYARPGDASEAMIHLDEDQIQITVKGTTIYAGTLQDEAITEFVY